MYRTEFMYENTCRSNGGICMKEGVGTLCFHCVGIELGLSIDGDFWSSRGGSSKGEKESERERGKVNKTE